MTELVWIGMTSARRQMVTLSYRSIECPKLISIFKAHNTICLTREIPQLITQPLQHSTFTYQTHIAIMSQNLNPDAVSDGREFAGHVKPSEPLMTGGVSTYNPSL
jgi:hypothetical protein